MEQDATDANEWASVWKWELEVGRKGLLRRIGGEGPEGKGMAGAVRVMKVGVLGLRGGTG